jgi:POT family proton-dependent oligopeptide transporter
MTTIVWLLFIYPTLFTLVIWLIIAGLTIIVFLAYLKQTTVNRNKLLLLLLLSGFSICYFIGNVQLGSSVLLFISRHVDTTIFGFYLPPSVFPAIEPLFVILLAPFFTKLWSNTVDIEPVVIVFRKVVLGLLFGGVSFFIFALATKLPNTTLINYPLICTILANLFVGAGELCIAPALIFAVTLLAPQKLQGMFMGIWLLLIAISAYLGSAVAEISAEDSGIKLADTLPYYHSFLTTATISSLGFILLVISYKFLLRKTSN